MILNVLIGDFTPTFIIFIAQAKTSQDVWIILADTYAKLPQRHIQQVKSYIKNLTKGSGNITNFIQTIKALAYELTILGAQMDNDDLIEKFLSGLGDGYKELVCPSS